MTLSKAGSLSNECFNEKLKSRPMIYVKSYGIYAGKLLITVINLSFKQCDSQGQFFIFPYMTSWVHCIFY